MNKKWIILVGAIGAAYWFFLRKPSLPAIGGEGPIGFDLYGSWDGTTVNLSSEILNQSVVEKLFQQYPAIQKIVDSVGITFTRG